MQLFENLFPEKKEFTILQNGVLSVIAYGKGRKSAFISVI